MSPLAAVGTGTVTTRSLAATALRARSVTTAGAAGIFVRLSSPTRSTPAGAGTRVADISAGFRTCTSKMKTGRSRTPS